MGLTIRTDAGNTYTFADKVQFSVLTAFADDTAAGVGGLTTGMLYQTTGLGAAPLNAAGIVMIKQ